MAESAKANLSTMILYFVISSIIVVLCLSGYIRQTQWSAPRDSDIKRVNGVLYPGQVVRDAQGVDHHIRCAPDGSRHPETCLGQRYLIGRVIDVEYFTPSDIRWSPHDGLLISLSYDNREVVRRSDRLRFFLNLQSSSLSKIDINQVVFLIIFLPIMIGSGIRLARAIIINR